jgi:hypothetical protein
MDMKKIKIGLKPYEYECGDHCCYEQGESVYVNDEHVVDVAFGSIPDVLLSLLSHLGYDVSIEGLDEGGEVDWTM